MNVNRVILSIGVVALFIGVEANILAVSSKIMGKKGLSDAIGSFVTFNCILLIVGVLGKILFKWMIEACRSWYNWVCTE